LEILKYKKGSPDNYKHTEKNPQVVNKNSSIQSMCMVTSNDHCTKLNGFFCQNKKILFFAILPKNINLNLKLLFKLNSGEIPDQETIKKQV